MMQVWRDQLKDALDWVAIYAEDWDACLNMVAELPETQETNEFLSLLVPRLKRHQRRFNWVTYDRTSQLYTVHNYDYKMWRYLTHRYPEEAIVTPDTISIRSEVLTDLDRDKLRAEC